MPMLPEFKKNINLYLFGIAFRRQQVTNYLVYHRVEIANEFINIIIISATKSTNYSDEGFHIFCHAHFFTSSFYLCKRR